MLSIIHVTLVTYLSIGAIITVAGAVMYKDSLLLLIPNHKGALLASLLLSMVAWLPLLLKDYIKGRAGN